MTADAYFDCDDSADEQIRAMARRQFGVSLVVGFALFAAALAIAGGSPKVSRPDLATVSAYGAAMPETGAAAERRQVILHD